MLNSVTNRRRLAVALGSGALLAGSLGYVGLVDPHKPDSVFPALPVPTAHRVELPRLRRPADDP